MIQNAPEGERPTGAGDKTLLLRLHPETFEQLRAVARIESSTLSDVVRLGLARYLDSIALGSES